MNFKEKYKPKNLEDIIGNEIEIKKIIDWLNTYENATLSLRKNGLLKKNTKGRKKKLQSDDEDDKIYSIRKANLLVNGEHGCGKSIIIQLILNKLDYDVFHLNKIYDKMDDDVDTNIIFKMVESKIMDDNRKKIILIDELEAYITKNDKKTIVKLLKENNYYRKVPILLVSLNQHNSQMTDIKKITDLIEIKTLDNYTILNFIKMICKKENININFMLYEKIIDNSYKDIRKILSNLNELKNIYGDKKIGFDELDEYTNIMKNKNYNYNIFTATNLLLTEFKNVNFCKEMYNLDTSIMPIMMYENYHKFMKKNNYDIVLDSFAYGDILENIIHSEQSWELSNITCILGCIVPSYYINKYSNELKSCKITYPIDLNKTTIKKRDKKKNKLQLLKNNQ